MLAQPLGSPWWTYADADAAYSASSLNELAGYPVRYLDHPGLPVEEAGTLAFGAEELAQRATGRVHSRRQFVDEELLRLDRARPVFRGVAVAIFLLGGILWCLLLARLLRHWTWGLAGGLLWIAAPGLWPMSIQFRPDVLLSVLLFVFAVLLARAMILRSPGLYAAAGVTLGLATMVKMHAAGAGVSLALGAILRPPPAGWWRDRLARTAGFVRRHRLLVAAIVLIWLLLAVVLNRGRLPFTPSFEEKRVVAVPLALIAAFVGVSIVARELTRSRAVARVLDPFYAFVAFATCVGIALPATLDLPDGMQSFVNIWYGLTGRGINAQIPLFQASLSQLTATPLKQALLVFAIAGLGAVVGIARRDPLPFVLFAGAAVLGVMAEARLAATHYFAPAYALSVPAALWTLRRRPGAASLLIWPIVFYIAWPSIKDRRGPKHDAAQFAAVVAPAKAYLAGKIPAGDVAFVPSYWPFADSRYFELVQLYVNYTPRYPYEYLPATQLAANYAGAAGLRFRYYVGPGFESAQGTQKVQVGDLGDYVIRRAPDTEFVYDLLSGPGADAPWSHPDARYDPWTGYYKDAAGRYWDRRAGNQFVAPLRRRYLPKQHVWVDAYGDLWNAHGDKVGNRPDLRTAPP